MHSIFEVQQINAPPDVRGVTNLSIYYGPHQSYDQLSATPFSLDYFVGAGSADSKPGHSFLLAHFARGPHDVNVITMRYAEESRFRWRGGEMTDEKRERQQYEREEMRKAIAAYTGPVTKCPPGRTTKDRHGWPRQRTAENARIRNAETTPSGD